MMKKLWNKSQERSKEMKIEFNEELHRYTNEDGKELISTTQLLKLAKISPDYSAVRSDILKASSEKGTLIHKEIEEYSKLGMNGFTKECEEFAKYLKTNNISVLASERLVADKNIAGTIDLVLYDNVRDKRILADIKTTSTIHKDSVSWQCSIYKYLWEYDGEPTIDELQVFHFTKDGELKVKAVAEKSKNSIEDLFSWYESHSEEPFVPTLEVSERAVAELVNAQEIIERYQKGLEEMQQKVATIREAIVQAMKDNGVSKFENDKIVISYIAPSTRTSLDSKALKEECPDIYKKYEKQTQTNEQVRIKLKGEIKNE
jgi:hypothetical protein